MQAVILAAGRGTRLAPITESRTKAMCPIVGKPMVERVMDTMTENGISDFVIVVSPDDSEIQPYFQGVADRESQLILVDQPEQLGMGHALLQAAPFIQGDFVLSSCDNLVEPAEIKRMLGIWESEQPNAILTLLEVGPEEIIRMGIVELSGKQVTRIVEKPTLEEAPSNIGSVPLYMFSHKLLQYLAAIQPSPRGEYELQDAMQKLIKNDGRIRGMMLPGRIDLTLPEDLLRLNLNFFGQETAAANRTPPAFEPDSQRISPIYIEEGALIGTGCKIGPNVFIERGAQVGDGAVLAHCVVLREAIVPPEAAIQYQVIV